MVMTFANNFAGDGIGIDPDTISASFLDKNAGISKQVSITANLRSSDGYMFTPGRDAGIVSGASSQINNVSIAAARTTATINKAPLTITGTSIASKTYDGTLTSGTVTLGTITGFVGAERVTVAAAGTLSSKDAGSRTATVNYALGNGANGGLLTNYSLAASTGVAATVTKAPLTVKAADKTKTYDGQIYAGGYGVSYAGLVNSETSAVLTGALSYSGTSQSAKNAGTYLITATGLSSNNYAITYATGSLIIGKKELTITGTSISQKAYDGTTVAGTLNMGVLSGFVDTETVTATGVPGVMSSAEVGVNTVQVSYTLADGMNGGLASNYFLGSGTLSALVVSSVSPSIIDAGFLQADSLQVGLFQIGRFSLNSALEFSNSWKYGVPPSNYQVTQIQFGEDSYDRFLDKLRPNQR
jgi:hypothetical protein